MPAYQHRSDQREQAARRRLEHSRWGSNPDRFTRIAFAGMVVTAVFVAGEAMFAMGVGQ